MTLAEIMFCLIRNEITGEALPDNIEYDVDKLIGLSKRHDLAHLVSDALIRNGIINEKSSDYKNVKKLKLIAIYREVQRAQAYQEIASVFSEANIQYVPLKGLLIRDMYPQAWMRSSCDIDILVHENDLKKAAELLVNAGFTTDGKKTYHDMSFFKAKVHLELHHNICEDNEQIDRLLSKVWDHVEPVNGIECKETKDYFVFHHVAHMFYHFIGGGCGVRPFLDLWIMNKCGLCDSENLMLLLEATQLIKFYNVIREICGIWFEGKERTDIAASVERFILKNGVYGTSDMSSRSLIIRKNGKIRYIFSLVFPPYNEMCINYQILKKHCLLLPAFYFVRIIQKIFGKDRNKNKNRLITTLEQTQEDVSEMKKLFDAIGYKI